MIMTTIFALAGGFFNWLRGGGIEVYKYGKVTNDVAFGLLVFACSCDYRLGLFSFFAMWIGRSFGWGRYVGAIINGYINPEEEIPKIDSAFRWLENQPRMWGIFTLGARGLMWTVPMGLALNSLLVMPLGAFMGVAYWLAYLTCKNKAWGLGEIYWGIILWASVGAFLVWF